MLVYVGKVREIMPGQVLFTHQATLPRYGKRQSAAQSMPCCDGEMNLELKTG